MSYYRANKFNTTQDEKIWEAHPGAQWDFMRADVFEVLLHGPRGGGKTDALVMDFCQHVGKGWASEWRGIIFRETYKQLDDIEKKCTKWIPKLFRGAEFNKNLHTWTFPQGEMLLLRHMKTKEDYQNYHGHEYPFIGWEELTNWATSDCYKLMISCCRSSVDPSRRDIHGRPMPRKYRATTNPYGKGHNWVKNRFRLPEKNLEVIREEELIDGGTREVRPRIAISAPFSENVALVRAEPDYIKGIREAASNPAQEAAWIEGTWDITSGGMFDDLWDALVHVMRPFNIPMSWRIERCFDWGSSKPASIGFWAISDGSPYVAADGSRRSTVRGDRFRINEWYVCEPGEENKGLKLTPDQLTEGIIHRELSLGLRSRDPTVPSRVRPGAADSSIWDEYGAPSIAAQMQKPVRVENIQYRGLSWEIADKSPGSRKNGWEAIRTLLKNAKPNKDGTPREKPGMFIFDCCRDFLRTVPSISRDDKNLDDVDTDLEDHIADETRYAVMTPKRVMRVSR